MSGVVNKMMHPNYICSLEICKVLLLLGEKWKRKYEIELNKKKGLIIRTQITI